MKNINKTFIQTYLKGQDNLNHLGMSGGSTKIAGIFGAAEMAVEKGFKPDIISGISAGSILALPLAMGKIHEIKEEVLNFNLDTIFDRKPVNKKGKLTLGAIFRALTGKPYLGSMGNLVKTIKKVITKEEFYDFINDQDNPLVFMGVINYKDGSRYYHLVNNSTYDRYLKMMLASASIPVFTPAVKMDNNFYYDGGIRDHCPSSWIMKTVPGIKNNVSIFSRPKDYHMKDLEWKPEGIVNVLQRTIDIMNIEISKNDELLENVYAEELGLTSHKQIFLPSLMDSLYDTKKENILKSYKTGRTIAGDYF